MTITNILIILFFFLQPLLLVGLLYSFWNRHKRLSYVRKTYRRNFNRSFFEISDYFFKALAISVIISILSVTIGIPLTIEWYIIYQIISIFLLVLFGSRLIHPLFTFPMTSIVLFFLNYFGEKLPINWLTSQDKINFINFDFQADHLMNLLLNSLLFIAVIILLTTFLMRDKDHNKLYPILHSSKRGKMVAKYQNKLLWLLPLVIVVPGSMISAVAPWWPLMSIGGEQFAILLLPFLIGFHFTVSTQLVKKAIQYIKKDLQILTVLTFVLFIASYFYRPLTIWSLVLVFILALFVLYRHRQREKLWAFRYGPADEGLRVIAVRPGSPANRMNLKMGTIITHINDKEMINKEDLYETVTYNRSYVKMRVKRLDGEVIMVETPLYDDDANNLGLLIL